MDILIVVAYAALIVAGLAALYAIVIVSWYFLPLALAIVADAAILVLGIGDERGNLAVVILLVGVALMFPWHMSKYRWREKSQRVFVRSNKAG